MMKKKVFYISVIASTLLVSCTIGPGGICGANIPAIYCASKEERDKVFHPKAYGQYWEKPGMTTESWRQDWVACGGRSNGQYSHDAPANSSINVVMTENKKKRESLGACMTQKGYVYQASSKE